MRIYKQSLEKTLEEVKKLDANPPGSKLTTSNLTFEGHTAIKVDATYFSLENSYLIYENGYTYVFNLFKGYKTNDVLTIFESLNIK